jgi:8-oxo-dGTP pyrophosphatase MutT (NUDIX family)
VFRKASEEKSCGAVIWRKRDGAREYLLAQHNGGHWSFPKGHVEEGETEEDTAHREILEETGLNARIDTSFRQVTTYYPKQGVVKDVIYFLATVVDGEECAQESEISQLAWLPLQDTLEKLTYACDEEVLLSAEKALSESRT